LRVLDGLVRLVQGSYLVAVPQGGEVGRRRGQPGDDLGHPEIAREPGLGGAQVCHVRVQVVLAFCGAAPDPGRRTDQIAVDEIGVEAMPAARVAEQDGERAVPCQLGPAAS